MCTLKHVLAQIASMRAAEARNCHQRFASYCRSGPRLAKTYSDPPTAGLNFAFALAWHSPLTKGDQP